MKKKVTTLVIYDVPNTRIRTKISEVCLDVGLERIQFSAFRGSLTSVRRRELSQRLKDLLKDAEGRLFVLPVCTEDWNRAFVVEHFHCNTSGELARNDTRVSHKPTEETILRW